MPVKSALLLIISAGFLLLNYQRLALPSRRSNVLRFAHTFTTASERSIIDDAVTEFEASHPGLRIEQRIFNSEVYNTVGWRLQFRSRTPPDIYFHWNGFKSADAIQRGWALELTPYVSPGFLDQFVPSLLPHRAVYFLPQSLDLSNLVWYNRDLFDQLSLQPPQSLADWFLICQRLRSTGHLPLAQGNRDLWPMGNFVAELLAQALGPARAAELYAPRGRVQPADLNAFLTVTQMRQAGWFDYPGILAPEALNQLDDTDAKILFLNGKCAQHIMGSWFFADVQDAEARRELPFAVDVFPVPPGAGESDATVAVATGYLVHPQSAHPQAAVSFLELLLSRKFQARFAQLGHLSGRRDAPEFIPHPLSRRLWNILAASPALAPPPDTGFAPEQATVFYRTCARLLAGDLDVPGAAEFWSVEKRRLAELESR